MSAIPALLIEGSTDSTDAADLVVRYRKDGDTDWNYTSAPVGLGRVLITGLASETLYNVEIGYRSILGVEPTAWTALDDTLTGQFTVETPDIVVGAAVRITADQDIGSSVVIPSRGGSPGYELIKTMDFDVDEPDSKFTVTVSFAYESSNNNVSHISLKIGQTAPIWSSGTMTNADAEYLVSAYNGPANVIYTFSGLSVGTNTLEVYGGSTGSGSHTNTAEDCYFSVREDKKAA